MDLSARAVRGVLRDVQHDGWDCASAAGFLADLRRCVVVPVVRRSGLRGPAAEQAEASGWEAAWDALRRPSARTAENPGGMVWTAVRRAVWAEVQAGGGDAGGGAAGMDRDSLDRLVDAGWQLADVGVSPQNQGPLTSQLVDRLEAAGWEATLAADAIAVMADGASHRGAGSAVTKWRLAAMDLGIPQWRARRLAALLLGEGSSPGVIQLVAEAGPGVLADPDIQAAFGSTSRRRSDGPAAWLAGRASASDCPAGA